MTTHLMVDIETLGTKPGAVVLSVALVRFTDEAHASINLDRAAQQQLGLAEDPATIEWWMKQDARAREAAFANPVPLAGGLQFISDWITWAGGPERDFLIWCHGASFDCPLLEEVYRRAGIACPWIYRQVRDTRTLYDLAGVDLRDYPVPPPHVALNDAISQTRAAVAALRIIAGRMGVAA